MTADCCCVVCLPQCDVGDLGEYPILYWELSERNGLQPTKPTQLTLAGLYVLEYSDCVDTSLVNSCLTVITLHGDERSG